MTIDSKILSDCELASRHAEVARRLQIENDQLRTENAALKEQLKVVLNPAPHIAQKYLHLKPITPSSE